MKHWIPIFTGMTNSGGIRLFTGLSIMTDVIPGNKTEIKNPPLPPLQRGVKGGFSGKKINVTTIRMQL
jgi:hypothetical protein